MKPPRWMRSVIVAVYRQDAERRLWGAPRRGRRRAARPARAKQPAAT